MTDEKRCEPPEHLRGSDGEHFVCGPNGAPFVALWHAAPHAGIEPLWHNAARTSTGTPAWAANEWGWRYLAHITPPATVAALVEALDDLLADTQHATHDCGDDDCPVRRARAVLALYRGEGRAMSDHIPDTGKMVPDAWVDAALDAYSDNEWRTSVSAMRAALVAVAPLIAAQERERCALVAESVAPWGMDVNPRGVIAAAIRALGDAT